MEVTRWERKEWVGAKRSVEELIRIHQRLHQHDKFAQVVHSYPFGKDIMPNTIRALVPRTDYEFFLARLPESKEILGWIALSFNNEGSKAGNSEIYETKLEWTQMCSHILRGWKIDTAGEKSNVWDMMERASSSLQAKNLPRHYCIINTVVVLPGYSQKGVVDNLIQHVIEYWKQKVPVGKEWAIWVQAPPFTHDLYSRYGFEEVGEYEVELGDYGYHRQQEREVFGKYNWKFMVRRPVRISATWESAGAEESDKGEGKERESEDVEEHLATWERGKGKGKEKESKDVEEHFATWEQGKGKSKEQEPEDVEEIVPVRKNNKGKEKEQQYYSPQAYQTVHPAYQTVHPAYGNPTESDAQRTRAWEEANERLYGDHSDSDAERSRLWEEANERLNDIHTAEARLSRENDQVTTQQQLGYIPSESAESLIEAMRSGGVDEEEIELVKSLAISLDKEARGE